MTDHGARWRDLSARIAARWGERIRYELEMRAGIAGEILDRSAEAEDVTWEAAIQEVLAGPVPQARSLPRLIAAALRRHVGAASQQRAEIEPGPGDTPYLRALAALLDAGPCPPPAS